MKKVVLYLHSSKEAATDAAKGAGIQGEALEQAAYLGYEHKAEYMVDEKTGEGTLVSIDCRKVSKP